jgi:hypothetical protein
VRAMGRAFTSGWSPLPVVLLQRLPPNPDGK